MILYVAWLVVALLAGCVVGVVLERGSFSRKPPRNALLMNLRQANDQLYRYKKDRNAWRDRAYAYEYELKKMQQKFGWAEEEQYVIQEQELT